MSTTRQHRVSTPTLNNSLSVLLFISKQRRKKKPFSETRILRGPQVVEWEKVVNFGGWKWWVWGEEEMGWGCYIDKRSEERRVLKCGCECASVCLCGVLVLEWIGWVCLTQNWIGEGKRWAEQCARERDTICWKGKRKRWRFRNGWWGSSFFGLTVCPLASDGPLLCTTGTAYCSQLPNYLGKHHFSIFFLIN